MNVEAWFRPGPKLVASVLLGTALLWALSGLTPGTAWEALETEAELEMAYVEQDWDRAAELGATRLNLDTAMPNPMLLGLVADAMGKAGRQREGLEVGERALTYADSLSGPQSREAANARNNLAWFLIGAGRDLERARSLAEEALASDEGNPFFLGTLGTTEMRLGRLEEARRHLKAAIAAHQVEQAKATDRVILAIVEAKLGHVEEAKKHYRSAVTDGPPDRRFREEARTLLGMEEDER